MSDKSALAASSKIVEEIEKQKIESRQAGRFFTAYTEDNFQDRDSTQNRPMIAWQSWLPAAPAGEEVPYSAGIVNLSPHRYNALFAYVFVAAPNIGGPGDSMSKAFRLPAEMHDFPGTTMPMFPGLSLDAGAMETLSLSLPIPPATVAGQYSGNCLLFRAEWHSQSSYCDSSFFVFGVR